MILSGTGIKLKLEKDDVCKFLDSTQDRDDLESDYIKIDPLDNPERQIGATSVDLRLGDTVKRFEEEQDHIIDVWDSQTIPNGRDWTGDHHIIEPQEFVLGHTIERIRMPSLLCGFVSGRSSLGRLGIIVHATANMIEPHFDGQITLEIANLGSYPVKLYKGMYVCQVSFSPISSKIEKPLNKKYQGETAKGPIISKIGQD